MVRLAVAGFGEISGEIVRAVLAEGIHDVTILSRKDAPRDLASGLTWVKVDYKDKQQLAEALHGIHTVLSFIVVAQDPGNIAQINLIDTCIDVGVKRFAPSEWAFYSVDKYPMYDGKRKIREYLENLNKEKKILEYCLFLPAVFMNYLGPPEKLRMGISYTQLFMDFGNCRAILPEGDDATVSFTTLEDVAKVVTKAIGYEGEWPVMGGIAANRTTISNLLHLGEKIRGKRFTVERVAQADLKANSFTTSWTPITLHPTIPEDQREFAGREFMRLSLLGLVDGVWDVSGDWNTLLPDLKLTTLEEFLREAWNES